MTRHQRAGVEQTKDGPRANCTCGAKFTRPTMLAAHTAQQLHAARGSWFATLGITFTHPKEDTP